MRGWKVNRMENPQYIAKKHLNHDQFGYLIQESGTGRCLGGLGANYYRPWVFPLYTPLGMTVLQEFPCDHPFHNGFFVGQGPIVRGDRDAGFWAAPPFRRPGEPLFTNLGRMDCATAADVTPLVSGVQFELRIVWRDADEEPLLDEIRTIKFYALEDATVCDMVSEKIANYGALTYPKTKFGSIGIRVEPRLLPVAGGVVLADDRRGSAEVAIDQECRFVAFENRLPAGSHFGVAMMILDDNALGPWFIRDYGLAFYNPTRNQSIVTPAGRSWTSGLRVIAYDGALTESRADRWRALGSPGRA